MDPTNVERRTRAGLRIFYCKRLAGEQIILYGDGMQVRDVLFVEDLVDAMLLAQQESGSLLGRAFNIGGGPRNAMSLLELLEIVGELTGGALRRFDDWRVGDQRYYVSDIRAFQSATGWKPRIGVRDGVVAIASRGCSERTMKLREALQRGVA